MSTKFSKMMLERLVLVIAMYSFHDSTNILTVNIVPTQDGCYTAYIVCMTGSNQSHTVHTYVH